MQYSGAMQMAMTVLLTVALIAGAVYAFELRTKNNVRRMTDACEKSGREVEFTSISWSGSVAGRCVVKPCSGSKESGRPDN